jgi:hypothetical protein
MAGRVTQLTDFKDTYARALDVSLDEGWLVFERARKWNDDKEVDLWIMGLTAVIRAYSFAVVWLRHGVKSLLAILRGRF